MALIVPQIQSPHVELCTAHRSESGLQCQGQPGHAITSPTPRQPLLDELIAPRPKFQSDSQPAQCRFLNIDSAAMSMRRNAQFELLDIRKTKREHDNTNMCSSSKQNENEQRCTFECVRTFSEHNITQATVLRRRHEQQIRNSHQSTNKTHNTTT